MSEEAIQSRYEALKESRRKRLCKPKGIPIEELIALKLGGGVAGGELSIKEVARRLGVSHQVVSRRLRAVEGKITGVKHFKKHRADILAMKQSEIINGITEKEIEGASLQAKTAAFGVFFDRERLERGKSTENVLVAEIDLGIKELEEEEGKILKELNAQPRP